MEDKLHRFTFDDRRRRFAAWAAATAARSSKNCRFTRDQGVLIIERSGLSELIAWQDLPIADDFDETHRELRMTVCKVAARVLDSMPERFSHGVAAKLINVYLKCLFLSGPASSYDVSTKERADALHPPIDRLLLSNLAANDIGGKGKLWRNQCLKGWSNFNSEDYQETIDNIRDVTRGSLWKIERYWLEPYHSASTVALATSDTRN